MKINVTQLLERVVDLNASDLHISVGSRPTIRVNTVLKPLDDYQILTSDDVEFLMSQLLDNKQRELLDINKELDFSVSLGQKARFRVNAFFQRIETPKDNSKCVCFEAGVSYSCRSYRSGKVHNYCLNDRLHK